ncbi:hypothetical protein VPH35_049972 [Triticum aestivum]
MLTRSRPPTAFLPALKGTNQAAHSIIGSTVLRCSIPSSPPCILQRKSFSFVISNFVPYKGLSLVCFRRKKSVGNSSSFNICQVAKSRVRYIVANLNLLENTNDPWLLCNAYHFTRHS